MAAIATSSVDPGTTTLNVKMVAPASQSSVASGGSLNLGPKATPSASLQPHHSALSPTVSDPLNRKPSISDTLADANCIIYEVKASDTVASIAAQYETTPSIISKLNKLAMRPLMPGQKLKIPTSGTKPTNEPTPKSEMDAKSKKSPSHSVASQSNKPKLDVMVVKEEEDERLQLERIQVEKFVKLDVKYITEERGSVRGILIVTPNLLMFDASVNELTAAELGIAPFCVVVPLTEIERIRVYNSEAALRLRIHQLQREREHAAQVRIKVGLDRASPSPARSGTPSPRHSIRESSSVSSPPNASVPKEDELIADTRKVADSLGKSIRDALAGTSSLATGGLGIEAAPTTKPDTPELRVEDEGSSSAPADKDRGPQLVSALSIDEKSDLFKPIESLIQRTSKAGLVEQPYYLRVVRFKDSDGKIEQDSKMALTSSPSKVDSAKSKRKNRRKSGSGSDSAFSSDPLPLEYWFAGDQKKIDELYAFFLAWVPDERQISECSVLTPDSEAAFASQSPFASLGSPARPSTSAVTTPGAPSATGAAIDANTAVGAESNVLSVAALKPALKKAGFLDTGKGLRARRSPSMSTPPPSLGNSSGSGTGTATASNAPCTALKPLARGTGSVTGTGTGSSTSLKSALPHQESLLKETNDLPVAELTKECRVHSRQLRHSITDTEDEAAVAHAVLPTVKDMESETQPCSIVRDSSTLGYETFTSSEIAEAEQIDPNELEWELLQFGVLRNVQSRSKPEMVRQESTPAPEIRGKSAILTIPQISDISKALPLRMQGYAWNCAYSSSDHGFSLSTLYRRLQNRSVHESPLVLVLQDTDDHVLGAVLSNGLHLADHYFGTGESFLYSFVPGRATSPPSSVVSANATITRIRSPSGHQTASDSITGLNVYNWSGENNFFCRCTTTDLSIGSGHGTCGLWIDENLYRGRTQYCDTFYNEVLTGPGTSGEFLIKHVEVWCFDEI